MYKLDNENLAFDTVDLRRVATVVDSSVTSIGAEAQADWIIFRLYHLDWGHHPGEEVSPHRLHQFAISSRGATALAHQLLELAAVAERETGGRPLS